MVTSDPTETKRGRSRRSNGKSISGCLTCRRRHVKCDETRPYCLNCKQSRVCAYGTIDTAREWRRNVLIFKVSSPIVQQPIVAANESDSHIATGRLSRHKERRDSQNNTRSQLFALATAPTPSSEGYSIRDVQLLEHFVTNTAHSIMGRLEEWTCEGVQLAFTNDFLLHAVLMTAASHLQRLNPASGDGYALQSAYHLNLSLRSFRSYLSNYTSVSSNLDAIFATCFLFIIYSYDMPVFDTESSILDPLLCHTSGIFDVLSSQQSFILPSILQPICSPELLPAVFPESGPAFNLILMVMTCISDGIVPDLNEEVYIATIENLTIVLGTVTARVRLGNTPPQSLLLYLVKWLSFLPIQFTNLINMHDPRALVIIAHYYAAVMCVLAKSTTEWWWMRERPTYMIRQITSFLGKEWEIWMQWPNEVVEKYQDVRQDEGVYALRDSVDSIGAKWDPKLGVLSETQLHCRRMEVNKQRAMYHRHSMICEY